MSKPKTFGTIHKYEIWRGYEKGLRTIVNNMKKKAQAGAWLRMPLALSIRKKLSLGGSIVCTSDISAAVGFLSSLPTWSAEDC